LRLDIRYWEIWNELENRPNMWTGTDAEFFRLFDTTSRAIKRRFPGVRVGGPAIGNVGSIQDGRLEPSPFFARFLEHCRDERVPLDFFSWHRYSDDPREIADISRGVRDRLDREGFAKTESHLNEWNYLPDNDWIPVLPGGQGVARERFYDRMGGAEGAAFDLCVLLSLQDCPLDQAEFYAGDTNPFGLFSRHGVPRKTFHAFKAFRGLLDTPIRVEASGGRPGQREIAAGTNRERTAMTILVADRGSVDASVPLRITDWPWEGKAEFEIFAIDAGHDLESVGRGELPARPGRIDLAGRGPAVFQIRVKRPDGQRPW
jgi:xylan 1,4-beta-xylosidase